MKVTLGSELFDTASQRRFAEVSGDWNPIHIDPVAARRTQAGALLVHGMHCALRCLNSFAKSAPALTSILKLTIKFEKPAYVGDRIDFVLVRHTGDQIFLAAEVQGCVLISIGIAVHSSESEEPIAMAHEAVSPPQFEAALDLNFAEIESSIGRRQRIEICRAASDLFPEATQWMGGQRVAALATLSTLVGMRCPGLHSIFLGLTVCFESGCQSESIVYSVVSADDRFRLVHLTVVGGGLNGEVQALVRTQPVNQLSIGDIAQRVGQGSFLGQHVLIIGGSRGLGECVAKIIAAGGGMVTISYALGVAEAKAIQAEILAFGGQAEVITYDVLKPPLPQLKMLKTKPTHVYYFATSRISGRQGSSFDVTKLDMFMQFYVIGFYNICSGLASMEQQLKIFYPSTEYIEKRPKSMTEYAMAKSAGEVLCADMKFVFPGIAVICKRLPRLRTDQTASAMPEIFADTLDVLLPAVMAMQSGT
jgi:acyl dehydratase